MLHVARLAAFSMASHVQLYNPRTDAEMTMQWDAQPAAAACSALIRPLEVILAHLSTSTSSSCGMRMAR
jgi:hypothetical protein